MLPECITHLSSLQSLDLSYNNLTVLPNILSKQRNLPHLRKLRLGKNPLSVPPAEILGEALTNEYRDANIEAIRSYFRQLQEKMLSISTKPLLIIGEGGAGKTSLQNNLLNSDCQLPNEDKSTKGIAILTWQFPLPAADGR